MPPKPSKNRPRLVLRPLRVSDLPAIVELHRHAYPGDPPWSDANLRDHIERFPEGQVGVELDGRLVATSSSLIVKLSDLDTKHTFADVCRDGFIRAHDPEGDTLYGIDITVDRKVRGMHLARRLYDARKELTQRLNLRGIAFGGRMPGYHRHAHKLSAEDYLTKVLKKELRDPVITAQRANGFMVSGVLPKYWPQDQESRGFAVFM